MAWRPKVLLAIFAAAVALLSGCAPGQPDATTVSPSRTPGHFNCYLSAGCDSTSSPQPSPAAPQSTPGPTYTPEAVASSPARSASPIAGLPEPPITPIPDQPNIPLAQPTPYYLCPWGTLEIGISYMTATPAGDQVKVVITGGVLNLASEDVLVPVPALNNFGTHIPSPTGSFDGAPGQNVVDFKPGQNRTLTYSATMSLTDFKASDEWGIDFNDGVDVNPESGIKYASAAAQAHSCAVRIYARPVAIINTFGPMSPGWIPR